MIDLESIGVPAFAVEVLPEGGFRYIGTNAACQLRTGVGDGFIRGRTPEQCQEPNLAARVVERYAECVERGTIVEYDVSAQFPVGMIRWRTWVIPLSDGTGRIAHLLGICNDLAPAGASADHKTANRHLSMALQTLGGASWAFDAGTRRFAASDAFALLLGEAAPRPVSWAEWCARVLPEDLAAASCDSLVGDRSDVETVLFRFRRGAGEIRWARCRRMAIRDGDGAAGICGVVVDVTEEHLREQELLDLASRDPLTGLLNRRGFRREAEKASRALPAGCSVALFLIDLDRFKSTNDTFGHPAGDAVLTETGRRLPAVLGDGAVLARLGGDEFAALHVLAPGESAVDLRAGLVDGMARPLAHAGRRLPMSASVGMALSGEPIDLADMMARADEALYGEKRSRHRRPGRAA